MNDRVRGYTASFVAVVLEAPFTQELIATSPSGVFAGAAFAPDGDVWTTSCGSDTLFRVDLQGVAPEPEPVAITPNFTG